ncbi:hypothetical protein ACFLJF_005382 [Salmonella enterica]
MSIDYIKNDYMIAEYESNPRGKCLACAKRVVQLLKQLNIPYRVIGLLTWTGLSSREPANHYAVVASINGQAIIIDPTAGQFSGWHPFYGNMDDWITGFGLYLPHKLIKGCEYTSTLEAECDLGSFFIGSPLDFNGVILQDTMWHRKIMKNPARFNTLVQKQTQALSMVPLRDLRRRSRWNCFKGNQ